MLVENKGAAICIGGTTIKAKSRGELPDDMADSALVKALVANRRLKLLSEPGKASPKKAYVPMDPVLSVVDIIETVIEEPESEY